MGAEEEKQLRSALAEERSERSRLQWLLSALYDTASDIAAIPDSEGVLGAIVQRTRAMTGADMAYLSLNDYTTGETFIRKSDGVRTEEYRTIRMPLGTGVLGKAATGMSIVSTTDYVADPGLVHLSDIDRIVAVEGVKSILGVPMIVHGRVQGALLIADRRPVAYTPETVEVVDTIARQGAVAIDYDVRLSQVTTALEALGEKQDADFQRVHALETALDLDRRMSDIVVQRGGVEPILTLVSSVYDSPVTLVMPRDIPSEDQVLAAALATIASAGLPTPVTLAGELVTVAPVAVGGRHFAWLAVQGQVATDRRDILERAALNLAMSLLMDEIEDASQTRSQQELFDDLVAGRLRMDGSTTRRLGDIGVDATKESWLLLIASDSEHPDWAGAARRSVDGPALMAVHDGHICLLHQQEQSGASLVEAALTRIGLKPLVATAHVGQLLDLPRTHRRGEIALATLRLLGGSVLDADSLGLVGALLEAESREELPHQVEAPAVALIDYDLRGGTDLVRTAWTWMEYGPRVSPVANRLMIHPNTLRQRLQRIASLVGTDWDQGAGRLEMHFALRSHMLRRELQASRS